MLNEFNKQKQVVKFPPISPAEKFAEQFMIYTKREHTMKNVSFLKKRNVTLEPTY